MTTELEHKAARERRYDLRTPIIRAIYDVCQAIEECGASEKLTHAVTLASALMEPVRVLLEERDALLAAPVPARECQHDWKPRWQQSLGEGETRWIECELCGAKRFPPPAADK